MLVGRQAECRQLDVLVSSARLGQSGVLVLVGEPGIGKTALLAYAKQQASTSMAVLAVTGSEAEQGLPFAGLAQLLRLSAEDLGRLPEPQAQALGVALALRSGTAVDRFAVGAGLLTLLTQRSEDQPLLLLVDDAHLLDLASQEALAFVGRRLLADAVALLAAARTDEPCHLLSADLPHLRVTGLDAAGTRELVLRTDAGRAGSLVGRVHELSGGNPLAICELIADRDHLLTLPPGAPALMATALAELYARRAAGLVDDTRTVVLVAAVAGDDLPTIEAACRRLGVDVGALGAAEDAGLLIVGEDRVSFTHPLARSGLYASASPSRRRELHAAIADVLPDREADRRAWHRCAAALGPDDVVAGEMAAVAQRAAERGAYAVAAAAAERSAALSGDATERSARWLVAGTWAWQGGDAVRARDLLDRAARLDPAAGVRAPAGLVRGIIAARCGALDEARDVLMAAGDASTSPYDRVACYAEAVDACLYLTDAAGARAAATRIQTVLDHADERTTTLGLVAAGMGLILAGQDGAALIKAGLAQDPAASVIPDGALDEATWRALGPLFLRDSAARREVVQHVMADRRAQSNVGSLPHLLFHIARDAATSDRWQQAVADYSEAIELAREFGQTTELSASLAGLAWLEARQGRPEATNHALEAIELAERSHVHLAEVWARTALADLALGAGDVSDAAARYTAIEDRLAGLEVLDVDLSPAPDLVEALVRLGDGRRASEVSQAYTARADAKGQPWARARATRAQALLVPDEEVDARFRAALALHAQTLDAYEEARTCLAYGARLRRQRRRVDAREPLRQALETFTRLGAGPWSSAAADELAATGLTIARPGRDPLSALTPRELQIAVLLGQGRTTRQVATALFVSPKTVEYHLRHVYSKLAITSRAELTAAQAGAVTT